MLYICFNFPSRLRQHIFLRLGSKDFDIGGSRGSKLHCIYSRTIHLELNLMNHSNLRISRALDLTEGGCNLIFALGFKTSPRKTRDGNRTIAFMIPLCREALSVQFRPTVSN